ncbi:AAA family ATPase [Rhodoferax sp.]|uniref:AAA family ATPase n=1 Tax=Rhodoferax sp. TaxID=50421 RepID=UPI00261C0BDE|nr:AAA family ATPase [Rhodoferax sp.]MDD2809387.1 AAA family ATPase [Rhodoferax sp.]
MSIKKKPDTRISLNDLIATSNRVSAVIERVRSTMLAPDARKTSPTFSTNQIATICGLDKAKMDYRLKKGDLPIGKMDAGHRRRFSLEDTRTWAKSVRSKLMRPQNAEAITIAVANFKGGVTKTTTAVTLAQGLSLRGHNVLVIDTDPQGSMTTLFGLLPDVDVSDEQTILSLCYGSEVSIDYAVTPTYWSGIDIVPANLGLYSAEFALPSRQKTEGSFEFWNVLDHGIDTARTKYDVIILDTSPSLSYLTINALLAADGLIMPLPPSTLDFTSSGQFWNLFNELTANLVTNRGKTKSFDFVDVLLARVDANDASSNVVREWITAGYANMVLPVEIPKTALTASASAEFGTVYDTDPATINARTYRRAFDAYERVVELVEGQIQTAWNRQLGEQYGA